jgi:hypothetical protein
MILAAAVLNGVASIAGGKTGFRKMFGFFAYASLIGALGLLVKLPLVFAKESIDVRTSVAAFTPSTPFDSAVGVLLNSLDVFAIWTLAVVVIGYSVLTELSTRKSVAIVVGLWALAVAIRVAAAYIPSVMMG